MAVFFFRGEAAVVVDFHTHTFPARIAQPAIHRLQSVSRIETYSDGTDEGLLTAMTRAGVDRSVVLPVATNPQKVSSMNDAILALPRDERLIRFGAIHPGMPDWRGELRRLAREGVRGVKLHPVYQEVDIDDPRTLRVLDCAGELGLTVVMHAGDDIGFPDAVRCTPRMTQRALQQVGPVTLVMAHMGGWRHWDEVAALAEHANAYLDTAFSLGSFTPLAEGDYAPGETRLLSAEAFCRLVRAFGAQRVLFATDSPWADQAQALRQFEQLPLFREEKQQILYQNALRLLKNA